MKPNPMRTYDELLLARVEQLREIDQRLDDMLRDKPGRLSPEKVQLLRDDLARMIREAEAEYDAF